MRAGVNHFQVWQDKQIAWSLSQARWTNKQIADALHVSTATVRRWLKDSKQQQVEAVLTQLVDDAVDLRERFHLYQSQVDLYRRAIVEEGPTDERLNRLAAAVASLNECRSEFYGLLQNGMKLLMARATETGQTGISAQFHYNAEEFYREIREYRRRVPLLAGQQPGLLESPEDKQRRVAEFIREYGTEKLPTETL